MSKLLLHLGCGRKILPGYVNIDAIGGDRQMDIRELDYPDDSVDEILAVHCWEHFWLKDIKDITLEWKRVLKTGGKLILEMPSKDKVFDLIKNGDLRENMTLWAMYGDPSTIRSEQDLHKWLWSYEQLSWVLSTLGFSKVEEKEPQYHVKIRDMRVEAIK